jgi:hypothetical protein
MENNNEKMTSAHKLKYYVLTGIIIFTLLILSIYVYIVMPMGEPLLIQESDVIFEIIEDGDIICRLGDRLWSQFFSDLSVMDKRYSHMGIIHKDNDLVTVIHAEGDTGQGRDFVHEASLDEFLKVARTIGIYRINNTDGYKISQIALEYLGIPFDWQFDMNDDSKLYCTELLNIILKRITPAINLNTIYIRELGKDIIPLEAISDSEYFNEVYFIKGEKNEK